MERYDRKGEGRKKKLKGTEGEGKGRQGGKEGKRKSQRYIFCKILWLGGEWCREKKMKNEAVSIKMKKKEKGKRK